MLMGFYEQVTVKDLRRLGSDQAAAVQRMEPAVVAADLDRILERDAVNGSLSRFHHGRALVIPIGTGKRPGAVVDHDHIHIAADSHEAVVDRIFPFGSAKGIAYGLDRMEIIDKTADFLLIDAGMDDDHFTDRPSRKDVAQGMRQDGLAAQGIEELVPLVAEAAPCAGRYDDDRYFHTFHLLICNLDEYHAPSRRLQDRRDRHGHGRTDVFLTIFDDNHRAVIEIGHALVLFLAGLDDEDIHVFPRDTGRFQRVSQVIDVEDGHALEGGNFIQVIVIGDDFGIDFAAQADELGIDTLDIVEIVIDDADFDVIIFLHLLQDIQAAAAFIALQQIRRIGNELQFFQDKDWHQQRPFQETGTANFGDAAVDDGARIEEFAGKFHIPMLAAVFLARLA